MSAYQKMARSCWHEECTGHCGECNRCNATCLTRDDDQQVQESPYNRYLTVGSVRYGMRLRAVSPPPPGAGPRYRSQCCWPNASNTVTSASASASGPVARIPLLSHPSINNLDIISCADRLRIPIGISQPEDVTASATTASDFSQLPITSVRDNVLYSTKCLLKRCALVRPQVYNRLCDHADAKPDKEDICNTLDRLPRFRFGGNRSGSAKTREFDKKVGEQRLKELTDRLKKGPVPPPRTRHSVRTPPVTSLPPAAPPVIENIDSKHVIPSRSASFSQVDFCADNNKYVRRQMPDNDNSFQHESHHQRGVVTLPRSKNMSRCTTAVETQSPSVIPRQSSEPPPAEGQDTLKTPDLVYCDASEQENYAPRTLNDSTNHSNNDRDSISQEKKRDKSKRRKGIYISQWPNPSGIHVIPQFVEDGSFASCSDNNSNILEDSFVKISNLNTPEDKKEYPIWSSPQEEPLSPEDNNEPPQWPNLHSSQRLEESNMLQVTRHISLLRADSLSEGEPDGSERRSDQSCLAASDVSDCESRVSTGNESYSSRRYSKRPLRGPYGQMLEAEMKKPEIGRKNINNELKFLEDLSSSSACSSLQNISSNKSKHPRSRTSCNSSIDDTPTKGAMSSYLSSPRQTMCKRKVSADNLVVGNNENEQKIVVSHQRTTSSPSKLEGFNNSSVSSEIMEQLLRTSSEHLNSSSNINLQKKHDTRTHVVVELYDNEKSYVESLQILTKKYLEPLKSPENAGLLDATLVDQIFYQIPFLLSHHEGFLDEMKKRLESWDIKQQIGDVFLEMFSKAEVIDCYTNYVNNWKKARKIIKNAQQSKPAFAKFIEATAREHKGKLALDSLLIKPIQKFPKYELLLQRLIKHTDVSHPDHSLLLAAQKEVHDHLLKINCTERETLELEQLRDIESLIEGLIELVSTDRQYLRNDIVSMTAGGGTRKDRSLFLFSDLLLVTSIKRRSGPIRRPATGSGTVASTLEANKYKLLLKIALEDLEIVRSKDENLRQMIVEMDNLTEDIGVLNQINELTWSLHCNHSQLDDVIRDMLASLNKQLIEQQSSDSQLSCLDLTLHTSNGLENISLVFPKPEKRASWEETFMEAKHKLAITGDRKPCPELVATVPIRKTRAGLQFTCAAPTLGEHGKDVWVCNSDGYVGQVCVLSLQPEPTVTSCNGVCNARIICVASVPGISYSLSVSNKGANNREDNEEPKTIQFDSGSSSDEEYKSDAEDTEEAANKNLQEAAEASCVDTDDMDNLQSTMWLGTEDGCIHVYNSSDNIRTKKNKIRLQLNSSIFCIIYLENRVFVSLANGDITIYERDASGGWNINSAITVSVGSTAMPVSKMLPNSNKLWCGCGNNIKVFNIQTLVTEKTFTVNNDSNKPITCLVLSGNGVWLSLQNSAIVKCFHAVTFESLCEVNVAPAVTKMLTSCDDIIRQHKAACLRVTALLACKDILWVGTSAGVLLTMPLPHVPHAIKSGKLTCPPVVNGISHGHTGHVRFLTYVEIPENQQHKHSIKGKPEQRSTKTLVISGGDGYEDFRSTNLSEVAGREDSTNHLLLWSI